ncbi:MAG: NAD-dependent epimerase/dehydratase family protein [Gammaproteobacteria bacterium]|nr:NAD-dependent epimerase/dehydratase family protein [Gammaproteobacteria bacterium]
MRILIIGGTKFIGPYVVQALHEKSHEVILFNRGKTIHPFPFQVTSIQGDRANLISFKEKLLSLRPDAVIDMFPYSEHDARQLANTFHGLVQRIVIVSSCDVYRAYDRLWNVFTDKLIETPLDEKSDLRENFFPYRKILGSQPEDWTYHYEKILVENTILSYPDINSTILRLPMVYGPGDYSRIYPYLKRMDDNRPILLDENKANWRFSRGYVEDIASAIASSALDSQCGNKKYNVGEKDAFSEIEWIQKIGRAAGWRNEIIKVSFDKLPPHLKEPLLAWEQDLTINTHRIRHELHYKELYSFEDSMQKTINWLRSHKPIQIDNNLFDYGAEDSALKLIS